MLRGGLYPFFMWLKKTSLKKYDDTYIIRVYSQSIKFVKKLPIQVSAKETNKVNEIRSCRGLVKQEFMKSLLYIA